MTDKSSSDVDFDSPPATKVNSPASLAHVVLRTSNFDRMVDFYVKFLGGSITFGNDMIAFITYDEEHHRIALLNDTQAGAKKPKNNGLEHIAFTFPTLQALLIAYRQRLLQMHLQPVWCVNHGPTISIYYKDPDQNMLETQVDNFETVEEATAFMCSPEFAENPIGVDIDPEEMIAQLQSGTADMSALRKRQEIGPRGLPDFH